MTIRHVYTQITILLNVIKIVKDATKTGARPPKDHEHKLLLRIDNKILVEFALPGLLFPNRVL